MHCSENALSSWEGLAFFVGITLWTQSCIRMTQCFRRKLLSCLFNQENKCNSQDSLIAYPSSLLNDASVLLQVSVSWRSFLPITIGAFGKCSKSIGILHRFWQGIESCLYLSNPRGVPGLLPDSAWEVEKGGIHAGRVGRPGFVGWAVPSLPGAAPAPPGSGSQGSWFFTHALSAGAGMSGAQLAGTDCQRVAARESASRMWVRQNQRRRGSSHILVTLPPLCLVQPVLFKLFFFF